MKLKNIFTVMLEKLPETVWKFWGMKKNGMLYKIIGKVWM